MPSGTAGSAGLAPGSVVAGLRIEERIGAGGMATVFRAYHDRLRRRVALKVLDAALASDSDFQRRFILESRAAAAVEDPPLIPVYDAGAADGVLYISMRYVPGGDLRSLVAQEGPLPAATVADFVGQIASALDAAHRAGLVHRDVKPANMLVDKGLAGVPGHIYLSDFGLSKPSLESFQLTATGQLLGTLDYIAPEQVTKVHVDGRLDQYALACAAFELLTGVPPFGMRKGMALVRAHLTELPPPVTARRANLSPMADVVLSRALAKDPDARYQTCREFAIELSAALKAVVTRASPPGAPAESLTTAKTRPAHPLPAHPRPVPPRPVQPLLMPPVPALPVATRHAPPTRRIGTGPDQPGPANVAGSASDASTQAGAGDPAPSVYDEPTQLGPGVRPDGATGG